MDGFGNINWWGFSPCVNLLENVDPQILKNDNELNILLLCAGDQRHILRTLADHVKQTKKKQINFYVYEKMLELYARDLLLLSIALEHPAKRGLQEKTELFMEIFGNLLVRDYSCKYVQARANEFIKYITDLEYLKTTCLSLFDFDGLKFKERDFLEGIFKFWRLENEETKPYFPAEKCWDFRLRSYFGIRYDTRKNAFDWDFSMKLTERKHAAIIHHKLYSNWRETGVAFDLRDSEYDKANFTLASSTCMTDPRSGDKLGRRGYFGDMIVGPYISYGIEAVDQKKFYKKQNELYRHTATEISQDNLNLYMKSIMELSGIDVSKYKLDENISEKLDSGVKITEIIEEEDENEDLNEKEPQKDVAEETEDYIRLNNCRIKFLPLTSPQDFGTKEKYNNLFDVVYFANSGAGMLDKNFSKVLKSDGVVLVESAKFMIELTNDKILGYSQKMRELAKECDLTEIFDKDDSKEDNKFEHSNVLKFKKTSKK